MKKILLILFAIFLLVGINTFAQTGQDWKWMHQTPQGNVLRYVKMWDANNWYAVGYAGTFMKTTNAGTYWSFTHKAGGSNLGYTGQSTNMYNAHFFNQSTGVVVGVASVNGGIARTTDGGATWDTAYSNTATAGIFYQVQFLNNNVGYAVGTVTPKIWKTTNGGINWTGIASAPTTTVYDIYAFDTLNLIISTTLGNVQNSTDGGATWSAVISTGSTTVGNKIHFINNNTGYLAGATGKFSFTIDGGTTWSTKPVMIGTTTNTSAYYDISVITSPVLKVFLTGDANAIYKTQDNGTTWDTIGFLATDGSQPWTSTYYASSLSATGDTIITAGNFGLINRRLNASNRQVFTTVKKATTTYEVWVQNSSPTGIIIAVGGRSSAAGPADQVLRSTNGGQTWTVAAFPSTTYGFMNSISMINDNTGFTCGQYTSVFKTTNSGASWDSVPTPFTSSGITKVLSKIQFVDANTGWCFSRYNMIGDSTIIKTTNGGATWFRQTLGNGLTSLDAAIYTADFVNANTGWIVNAGNKRPYHTTDGGNTWTKDSIVDVFNGTMNGIDMVNETTGYIVGTLGRIYKTTNGGLLWDTLSKPGWNGPSWYGVKFLNSNIGAITGSNGMTLFTSNGGINWNLQNTSGSTMQNVYLVPGAAYTCGTTGSIWKNNTLPTVIESHLLEIPRHYKLEQNYPNPFNPTTNVQFSIPNAQFVTLKVFNILGKEVSTLVNEKLSEGIYSVNWNAAEYPSGVYFYKLITDGYSETKRMLLLK